MLFTSYLFLFIFLPVTLAGFFLIARQSRFLAALWLAAASLVFYAYWNPKFVFLLLSSVLFNYFLGAVIGRRQAKKLSTRGLLALAVTADLALLGFFKYTNFFLDAINQLTANQFSLLSIVLPLGISFFTFTQIAFLVDVHRGQAKEYRFVHYLLFVTYFPHLIAGPILHHKQIMPQFAHMQTYRINPESIASGICFFVIGFAKKILLADSFGAYATPIFDAARDGVQIPLGLAWVGALSYALQLYFDFSGYSDMAIGLSKLFGVNIPINFNSPYKSKNIIEFWQRWHMTLSQFLRDYLYIPLGGNRRGPARRYFNLLITMIIGGLWHGANWTFVAWGAVHGIALAVNHGWHALMHNYRRNATAPAKPGNRIYGVVITFLMVSMAWVLFRAETFSAAVILLKGMFGASTWSLPGQLAALKTILPAGVRFDGLLWSSVPILNTAGSTVALALLVGLAIVFLLPNSQTMVMTINHYYQSSKWAGRAISVAFGSLLAVTLLETRHVSEFLYFQF